MAARDAAGGAARQPHGPAAVEGAGTGNGLPAPYRNPWRNLSDDLRAIAADLRLLLWRQGRRNREGELWRPSWWPADLAPLFWPLSLGLIVVSIMVLLGAPALWRTHRSPDTVQPVAPLERPQIAAVPVAPDTPFRPDPAASLAEPMARDGAASSGGDHAAEGGSAGDGALNGDAPAAAVAAPPPPQAPEPPSDLLEELRRTAPAAELLGAATAEPATGTLVLQLRPAFLALGAPLRLQRAEAWQRLARELGFDHLELRDGAGGLLARDALVGSGMIVLPAPPAP